MGIKKREREWDRERMVKDEVMAQVKETEWWDSISPYSSSEIDLRVLELNKPDSWGTGLQVCSPTCTNKDIRDIDVNWTTGHRSTACWLYFWFVMPNAILHSETHAFYTLSNRCSFYPVCAQLHFLILSCEEAIMSMSKVGFSHKS